MIKFNDPYEAISYVISQPRDQWCDLLMPYIASIEKNSLEISGDPSDKKSSTDFFPDMNHFSKNYKGRFNIGDYVTHKVFGGYYRVVSLEALDIRNDIEWSDDPYQPEFIQQFGDSYFIFGIDSKGQKSGSELYSFGIHCGKDLLLHENNNDDLELIPEKKLIKEIKNKVNKFVYSFNYTEKILKQLKDTE